MERLVQRGAGASALDAGHQLFVSYASADRARVFALVDALTASGFKVWIDRQHIPGGTHYAHKIPKAIREAQAMILMVSQTSVSSINVQKEVELAERHRTPILPLLIETVAADHGLEYHLATKQYIVVGAEDWTHWLEESVAALAQFGVAPGGPDESRGTAGGASRSAQRPPALLPYMVNRSRQDDALTIAMEQHVLGGAKRPLLVMTHGASNQEVDAFIIRIKETTLAAILRRLNLSDVTRWIDGRWPIGDEPAAERRRRLMRSVTDAFSLPMTASLEDVHRAVLAEGRPVVLSMHAGADLWQTDEAQLIAHWCEAWSAFPDLPPRQPLVLLFSSKYPIDAAPARSLIGRLMRRQAPTAERARAVFAELAAAIRPNLPAVLLPELGDVTQDDVEHWVRTFVTTADPVGLLGRVKLLFDAPALAASRRAPMEPLAQELKSLLAAGLV
jgi:hypothetical protein